MAKKKSDMCFTASHKIAMGIGLFIFGLVKYLGYSWEMAFMVVGILAILKGLWMLSK